MTLDEAIKHCLEVAERYDRVEDSHADDALKQECIQCAEDYRQLAEWLTELKDLRILIGGKDNYLTEPPEQADLQPVKIQSVVHCKDCKYAQNPNDTMVYCTYFECGTMSQDDFCSQGDRRAENAT